MSVAYNFYTVCGESHDIQYTYYQHLALKVQMKYSLASLYIIKTNAQKIQQILSQKTTKSQESLSPVLLPKDTKVIYTLSSSIQLWNLIKQQDRFHYPTVFRSKKSALVNCCQSFPNEARHRRRVAIWRMGFTRQGVN